MQNYKNICFYSLIIMATYEVIVIGSGPAGLSAAIYLSRAKVNVLVVGRKKQSQLIKAYNIENYFGFPEGIKGVDLLERGIKQAKKFGAKIIDGEVIDVHKVKNLFSVKIGDGTKHSAKALVIATGTPLKLSGIENEEKYTSKGVHYCIECDGPFYHNKKLALLGNGDHAAEEALEALSYTKNITIISNTENFTISEKMQGILKSKNIKLLNAKVKEFAGNEHLENVILEDGESLQFDGIFMACGMTSALDFASKLVLGIEGNIVKVDEDNKTNVEGVFAAGNCSDRCRQVAHNVGDGCNAALSAIKYLRHRDIYVDYGPLKGKDGK